jgi:hypothetical protein
MTFVKETSWRYHHRRRGERGTRTQLAEEDRESAATDKFWAEGGAHAGNGGSGRHRGSLRYRLAQSSS